jgi:hypothetical protein
MRIIAVFIISCWASAAAFSAEPETLTPKGSADALKQVLTQSIEAAVDKLGVANGFLDNPKVKIPLPGTLQKAEGLMRGLGMSKHPDNLVAAMNRAAETATAEAKPILLDAVRHMPIDDAKTIFTGGGDSATQYFRSTTLEELSPKFLAIVKKATDQVGLLKKYNDFAGKGAKFGLVPEKHANIDHYVAQKTLDGIFLIATEEERVVRDNPAELK